MARWTLAVGVVAISAAIAAVTAAADDSTLIRIAFGDGSSAVTVSDETRMSVAQAIMRSLEEAGRPCDTVSVASLRRLAAASPSNLAEPSLTILIEEEGGERKAVVVPSKDLPFGLVEVVSHGLVDLGCDDVRLWSEEALADVCTKLAGDMTPSGTHMAEATPDQGTFPGDSPRREPGLDDPGPSTPADAGPPSEGTSNIGELEGVWELNRYATLEAEPPAIRIAFSGSLYAYSVGDTSEWVSILTVDPDASPKRLSFTDYEGTLTHGIYDVQGDGLRLSVAPASEPLPTRFGTEHPEFQRVTKEHPEMLERLGKKP